MNIRLFKQLVRKGGVILATFLMAGVFSLPLIAVAQGGPSIKSTTQAVAPNDCPPIIIDPDVRRAYLSQQKINRLTAPIHSRSELQQYLKKTPISDSPLGALSPDARKRFLSALRFSDLGLSTYRYSDLEQLTATQAYKILSLFGVQMTTNMIGGLKVLTPADEVIMDAQLRPNDFCDCFPGLCGGSGGGGGGGDHQNYKCVGRGTCAYANAMICTHNC